MKISGKSPMLFEWLKILFSIDRMSKAQLAQTLSTLMIVGAAFYYGSNEVEAKHLEAIREIRAQQERIQSLEEQNSQTLNALNLISQSVQNISNNISELKDSTKTMDSRILQIYRDVYTLKQNNRVN